MDVSFVTTLAVLAAAVSLTSPTLFPEAFNCCTKISEEIPKGILRRVERFEIQKHDGLCHLHAVILHIEGRKFCVSPEIKRLKKWMKKNKHTIPRKKHHGRKQRRTKLLKKKRINSNKGSPVMKVLLDTVDQIERLQEDRSHLQADE